MRASVTKLSSLYSSKYKPLEYQPYFRYSTAGRSVLENAQPVCVQTLRGQIAIAQNGNLTTAKSLRQELLEKGLWFPSLTLCVTGIYRNWHVQN